MISPLSWGLGHAARIAGVIRFLMRHNEVSVMCGQAAYGFLSQEIPDADLILIDDWRIRYPKGRIGFWDILGWVPVMMRNSIHEHIVARRIVSDRKIDLVISDNRYGLVFRNLECMIVTHQVYPKMPRGFGWLENVNGWIFKKYLSLFDKVLIPDFAEGECLTGLLAAERKLDPDKFIRVGILSRYSAGEARGYQCTVGPEMKKYDVLLLISGQEDQRTVFENLLISALADSGKRVMMVRGVAPDSPPPANAGCIEYRNMLSGKALELAIRQSAVVICRAGYSTLCDVVAMGKRAIIVPTPGQTEQEYLAMRLDGKFGFRSLMQDDGDFSGRILPLLQVMGEGVPYHE